MNKIKIIILDFDGVLVESVDIKHNAFRQVFSEYPEYIDDIMKYHFKNNSVVRYVKFRHIVENILGKPYTKEREKDIIDRFTSYTRTSIIQCPYVPGAPEFLDHFKKKVPMYLASATPLEELFAILEGRKLTAYFKKVYGAPRKKSDIFAEIIAAEGAGNNNIIFVGDSETDYAAAKEAKIGFVGRNNKDDLSKLNISRFDTMFELRDYIQNLLYDK